MGHSASPSPHRWTRAARGLLEAPLRVHRQHLAEPVPLHWHEFYELAFILTGGGTHRANGREVTLRAGMVVALTPADFHELGPDLQEGLDLIVVIFPAELLDPDVQRLLLASALPLEFATTDAMAGTLEADFLRLLDEERIPRPDSRTASRATLQRIVVDVTRAGGAADPPSESHTAESDLRAALLYLHHHFREPLELADVATKAHLSPHYFSERFRQLTGAPFQRYRQELRLQFARSLLAASELPVTEVCYAAGFNTLSHFERAFRARWGFAPSALRGPEKRASG